MTVLCKGSFFKIPLLGTMTDHELRLHQCHLQLEEDQGTHNTSSSNFMDVLGNLLAGKEQVIHEALDVVLDDEVNRSRETIESNLVAIK